MPQSLLHIPVLLNEVLFYLNPGPNENFIDCTFGGGGHSRAILEKTRPNGKVLAIDLDKEVLNQAAQNFREYRNRLILVNDNFANLKQIVEQSDLKAVSSGGVNGILIDLGVSSIQLAGEKGFSFKSQQRLDMRFGGQSELDAYQIVNFWPESEIKKILFELGEERFASQISKKIIEKRKGKPIETGVELAGIVAGAIPRRFWPKNINPATKTFQALRMAVNTELDNLASVLPQALEVLKKGGRLAVISFHSLEDRMVKRFFKKESKDCLCPPVFPECRCNHRAQTWLVTKKIIIPSPEELKINPRAGSAKLRVVEKI